MSEPYLGQIMQVGFNFPPQGWAACDGQLVNIAQNSAVFSLLGTTFGGDGETTFALPDLRSRVAMHVGTGSGLSNNTWGQKKGSESHTLTVDQLPSHNHKISVNSEKGNSDTPVGGYPAVGEETKEDWSTSKSAGTFMAAGAVEHTGPSQPVTHMPPTLGIYHVIALVGLYPSRS